MTIKEMMENTTKNMVKELTELAKDGNIEGLYDWMDDNALDVTYICDRQKRLQGAEILVEFGGPNTYVNTRESIIESYWGGDVVKAYLPQSVSIFIDDSYTNELFKNDLHQEVLK